MLRLEPAALQMGSWALWVEDEGLKKQLKHHLGLCSLVCRYWAKHCRHRIFETITLRSQEDAMQLLEFTKVTTAGMSVRTYTSNLNLRVTLPSPPWVHLVINAIPYSVFPKIRGYTLTVSGIPPDSDSSDDAKSFAPRSIFYGLPRSLPATKRAVSLTLDDMHFKSFDDLVSFVDSLMAAKPTRRSTQTDLNRVSWSDNSSLSSSITPRAFSGMRRSWRKRFPMVAVTGCTATWPLLWLLVTTERPGQTPNHPPLYVDGAEVRRITAIVQSIMDDCRCAACGKPASEPQRTYLNAEEPIRGFQGMCAHLPLPREQSLTSCAPEHATVKTWNGVHDLSFSLSDGLVTVINLTLVLYADHVPNDQPPEAFNFSWAVLDKQVAAFNTTMTTFRVQLPDAEYAAWESFVCTQMPMTRVSGRLKVECEGGKSSDESGDVD